MRRWPGGVQINYVPRDGGNTFKGLLFYSFANGSMQRTNYSSATRDAATGSWTPADSFFCRGLTAQPGSKRSSVEHRQTSTPGSPSASCGQYEEALTQFRRALAIDPHATDAPRFAEARARIHAGLKASR